MESAYVTVGVDIGQKVDPTAFVVCEATRPAVKAQTSYTARMIQRLPLGTPYPEVAAAIVDVVANLRLRTTRKPLIT